MADEITKKVIFKGEDLVTPTLKAIDDRMRKFFGKKNSGEDEQKKKVSKEEARSGELTLKGAAKRLQVEKQITKELEKQAKLLKVTKDKEKEKPKPDSEKPEKPGSGMGFGQMAGAVAVGNILANIAGRIKGMLTGQMHEAYNARNAYGMAYSGLIGTTATPDQLKGKVNRGVKLGYTPAETAQIAADVMKATGSISGTDTAQGLARGYGMSTGDALGAMGSMTRLGQGFGGKGGVQGYRQLERTMAAGMASGLDKARMPEFLQAVTSVSESVGSVVSGDVNVGGIASIMAALGSSGKSGLQGNRGASVLAAIDAGIKNPGGGEAGQALMLRAFGFGTPGGENDYYAAKKRQQQGIAGEGNIQALFAQTAKEYGNGEAQIMALSEMTGGLSYDILEQLREVNNSTLSSEEKQAKLNEVMEQTKPIEEQALHAMQKGFGDQVARTAELEARLVEMGDQIKDPMDKLADIVNHLVDSLFPVAVEILRDIASFLEDLVEFTGLSASDDVMDQRNKNAQAEMKALPGEIAALDERRRNGQISAQEYASQSQELKERVERIRRRVRSDRNMIQGAREDAADWLDEHGLGGTASMVIPGYVSAHNQANARRSVEAVLTSTRNSIGQARSPLEDESVQNAIAEFAATREGRRLQGSDLADQERALLNGGSRASAFHTFLESDPRYNAVLTMIDRLAQTVDRSVREQNEGPAASTRRGSPARVERP